MLCTLQAWNVPAANAEHLLAPPSAARSDDYRRKKDAAERFLSAARTFQAAQTTDVRAKSLSACTDAIRDYFDGDLTLEVMPLDEQAGSFEIVRVGADRAETFALMKPAPPGVVQEDFPGYILTRTFPASSEAVGEEGTTTEEAARLTPRALQPQWPEEPIVLCELSIQKGEISDAIPPLDQNALTILKENFDFSPARWENFVRLQIIRPLTAHIAYLRSEYPGLHLLEGERTIRFVVGSTDAFEPCKANGVVVLPFELFLGQRLESALDKNLLPHVPTAMEALQISSLFHQALHESPSMKRLLNELCREIPHPKLEGALHELFISLREAEELDRQIAKRPGIEQVLRAEALRPSHFRLRSVLASEDLNKRAQAMALLLQSTSVYPADIYPGLARAAEILAAMPNYTQEMMALYRRFALRLKIVAHPEIRSAGITSQRDIHSIPPGSREVLAKAMELSEGHFAVYSDTDLFSPENPARQIGSENVDLTRYQDALGAVLRRATMPVLLFVGVRQRPGASLREQSQRTRYVLGKRRAWLQQQGVSVPVFMVAYNPESVSPGLEASSPAAQFIRQLGGRHAHLGGDCLAPGPHSTMPFTGDFSSTNWILANQANLSPALIGELLQRAEAVEVLARRSDLTPDAQKVLIGFNDALPILLNNREIDLDPDIWPHLASMLPDFETAKALFTKIQNPVSRAALWKAVHARDSVLADRLLVEAFSTVQVLDVLEYLNQAGFSQWHEIIRTDKPSWYNETLVDRMLGENPELLAHILHVQLVHASASGRRILEWMGRSTHYPGMAAQVMRQVCLALDPQYPGAARFVGGGTQSGGVLQERAIPIGVRCYVLAEGTRAIAGGTRTPQDYAASIEKALLDPELLAWLNVVVENHPKLISAWLRIVVEVPWIEEFRTPEFRKRLLQYGDEDVLTQFLDHLQQIRSEADFSAKLSNQDTELRWVLVQGMAICLMPTVENKEGLFGKFGILRLYGTRLPEGVTLTQVVERHGPTPAVQDGKGLPGIPPPVLLALVHRFGDRDDILTVFHTVFSTTGVRRSRRTQEIVTNHLLAPGNRSQFMRHGFDANKVPLIGTLRLAARQTEAQTFSSALQERLPHFLVLMDALDDLAEQYRETKLREFLENIAGQPSLEEAERTAHGLMLDVFKRHLPGEWTAEELERLQEDKLREVANYWFYARQWYASELTSESARYRDALGKARILLGACVAAHLRGKNLLRAIKYGGSPESRLQLDVNRRVLVHRITGELMQQGIAPSEATELAQQAAEVYIGEWMQDLDESLDVSVLERKLGKVHAFTNDDAPYWLNFGSTGGGFCFRPPDWGSAYTRAMPGSAFSAIFKGKQLARYPGDLNNTVFESCLPTEDGRLVLLNEVLYSAFLKQPQKLPTIFPAILISAIRNAGRYGADEVMVPIDAKKKFPAMAQAVEAYQDQLVGLTTIVEHKDADGALLWAERITVTGLEKGENRFCLAPETNLWKYWVAGKNLYLKDPSEESGFKTIHLNEDDAIEYAHTYPIADIPEMAFEGLKISYEGYRVKLKRERLNPQEITLWSQEREQTLDRESAAQAESLIPEGKLVLFGREPKQKHLRDLLDDLRDVDRHIVDYLKREYTGFAGVWETHPKLEEAVAAYNARQPADGASIHLESARMDVFCNVAAKLSRAMANRLANVYAEEKSSVPLHILAVPRGGLVVATDLKKQIPYQGLGHVRDASDMALPEELFAQGDRQVILVDIAINTGKTTRVALETLFAKSKVKPSEVTLVTFAADPQALLRLLRLFPDLKRVYAIDLVGRVPTKEGIASVLEKIGTKIMPDYVSASRGTLDVSGHTIVVGSKFRQTKSLTTFFAVDQATGRRYLLKVPVAPATGRRIMRIAQLVRDAPGEIAGMRRVEYDEKKRALLSEYVPGALLGDLPGDEAMEAKKKAEAIVQLVRDAAGLLQVLSQHGRYPIFTTNNLLWDSGQNRWFLTNLGPGRYHGKSHRTFDIQTSMESLEEVWSRALYATLGLFPGLQQFEHFGSLEQLFRMAESDPSVGPDQVATKAARILDDYRKSLGQPAGLGEQAPERLGEEADPDADHDRARLVGQSS